MPLPLHVISLERSQERRKSFLAANAHLDFQIFPAVDGSRLPQTVLQDRELFIPPLPFPTLGAYGVALSHLRLWERAIDTGSALTVAEDDAVFRQDFASASEEILRLLPQDWDFVLWGWNFDSILSLMGLPDVSPSVMVFNQDALRANLARYKSQTTRAYPLRLDKCFGIPAYSISPKGARRFKEHCFPLRNFSLVFPLLAHPMANTGIDIAMNQIYSSTQSFVSYPPLAVTENRHDISTIQVAGKV